MDWYFGYVRLYWIVKWSRFALLTGPWPVFLLCMMIPPDDMMIPTNNQWMFSFVCIWDKGGLRPPVAPSGRMFSVHVLQKNMSRICDMWYVICDMQQIIPAIFLISVFLYLSSKKKEEKTPLLIFTKTKYFIQTQIFEKLRESCGKVAGILREFKISK